LFEQRYFRARFGQWHETLGVVGGVYAFTAGIF
jgi:hypothetical protein